MSLIGVRFARAIQNGRTPAALPSTREGILVSLLNKRAIAARIGAEDLEAMLRQQIRWSLPIIEAELANDDGDWVEEAGQRVSA